MQQHLAPRGNHFARILADCSNLISESRQQQHYNQKSSCQNHQIDDQIPKQNLNFKTIEQMIEIPTRNLHVGLMATTSPWVSSAEVKIILVALYFHLYHGHGLHSGQIWSHRHYPPALSWLATWLKTNMALQFL